MAIMSAQEMFSDAQAITVSAASTNVIDFGSPELGLVQQSLSQMTRATLPSVWVFRSRKRLLR